MFTAFFIFVFTSNAYAYDTGKSFLESRRLAQTEKTELTVFMYHLLSENSEAWTDYCVSPEIFESDIKYLIDEGYKFLSPDELNNDQQPGKYAVITFDDGYESDYLYALPIIEKYQIPAVFFIVSDYIGKDGYLSEEELKLLSDSKYVTVGSHTNKIHDFAPADVKRMFTSYNNEEYILNDIKESFFRIENLTGKNVDCLSYPYGIFSKGIDIALKKEYGGLVTFSSQEKKHIFPCSMSVPLGRINRGIKFKLG